jgi:hypothetical protein
VGAARSATITALEIGPEGIRVPMDQAKVTLVENPGGVTRMRLSVDPFGPVKQMFQGRFVGMRGKFLYAFAQDGSVRVVDLNRTPGGKERECDVNVDPSQFSGADVPCSPVADGRPRRVMADGPGIRIPVSEVPEVGPPVPVDVAFALLNISSSSYPTALLLASNGQIYHLSLEAYGAGTGAGSADLPVQAHNFRRVPPGQGSAGGGLPSVPLEPDRQFTPNRVPFPARAGYSSRLEGPRLEPVGLQGANWVIFPRPFTAVPEDFWLSWEADLPNTQRGNARLEPGPTGGSLFDPGADFCRWGVQPGDALSLSGCDQDADCDQDRRALYVCHRATPGAQGVCLPRDFVADEERLRVCRPQLSSRRRYEVREVFRGRLDFALKLDEVPLPRQYPCDNDLVCQPDASHQRSLVPGDQGFQCLTRAGDTPRCLKACGTRASNGSWQLNDRLCRAGHVCVDLGDAQLGPLCVEAPPLSPECLPPTSSYRVQVGQGYLVTSTSLPFLSSQLEEVSTDPWGGRCLPDPNRNPLYGQRIPLSAPHCQNVADGAAAQLAINSSPVAEGAFGNPCLFRSPNADSPGGDRVKALFENPHVRFVLTNLEQYVGDGTTIQVSVEGGFSPLRVRPSSDSVRFGMGVRILTSPIDSAPTLSDSTTATPPPYLFVIDQGRTSTTLSRGQVLRVNPRPAQLYPGGFIDSAGTNSLFPVQ